MSDKDQKPQDQDLEQGAVDQQTAEPPEGADQQAEETGQGDPVSALQAELETTRAKAEENWNEFLRARAELENMRRRMERDVAQARRYGVEKLATELLSVRDSLEMGLSAAREANADVAKLTEGTELTLKMLNQAMDKFDIREVDPLGEKFNPDEHEAMAMQPSAEHAPNTVIHVVQKGYRLSDRLLRPAMVVVSRQSEGDQSGEGQGKA
ncbi:MAG: nucleotide exchange factor GrpE [Ectothiorhodospiraceae bacterium]|nr:nucleotide exchange factor GrpE [Ectothiorhodospiraceae bacterium]